MTLMKRLSATNSVRVEIAGKTVRQWEEEWIPLKGGFTVVHSDYRHQVGLFRAILQGRVMYVGKAVEVRNGGLRKRLSDFRRKSPSARKHYGAMRIRDHLKELDLEVLCTGSDVDTAELLKPAMIKFHFPPWNMEKAPPPRKTRAAKPVGNVVLFPGPSKRAQKR